MKKRKKLSRKMTFICGIFVLILSVTLGLLGIYTYKTNVRKRYEQYVETIIKIAGSYIDIEDTVQCIETGDKTEDYERTQAQLDHIKTRSDVEYIYVIKPLNTAEKDNAMYIWNATTQEEKEIYGQIDSLGNLSGEGFSREMAEMFMTAMDGGDAVTYYANKTEDFGYMLTGMYPLRTDSGETIALACVDISMNQIYQDIYQYILFVLAGTLAVGTVFLLALIRLINKSVVSPVIRMSKSTEDFVKQSNSGIDPARLSFIDPKVATGDEIQLLSENLNEMTSKLVVYMGNLQEAAADKERIGAELNVATGIKSSMLPNVFPAFPERSEFDIYADLRSAEEMTGNFYDFFFIDQNHLAVVIGDVNGMGVPAALLIVITQTLIKNYTKLGFEPEKVFREANNQLSESSEGMTTAAFLGILDLTTGLFRYVNAGHSIPLLKHAGGVFEPLPAKDCFVLGSMAGVPYWQQSVQLFQGDMLFFYTKGVIDAENKDQVQYSYEHMHMRLNQILGQAYELPDILGMMSGDLEEFLDGQPAKEDVTMMLCRYFGS
ncbi:MAG: serine/threonine-protein phosphatase [Lachnospiraceae bacterium]|nr:serine/threonine-protein phosphatase [Lachnospiraceae bacterium]